MKLVRLTLLAFLFALAAVAMAPALNAQGGYTPSDKPLDAPAEIKALDEFTILGTTVGYVRTDRFLKFMSDADAGIKPRGMFEGQGPLAILLIVFLGGLALNLTPCVLPMIPINLAIIGAGTKAGSRGRGFLLGGAYGAAMAAVYGILGVVVILTAGSFGTLNASPWFNTGIAALFILLGLAMFDVFTIDFSRWSSKVNLGARGGSFYLAFGMGAIAALLAGACVAPVIIQVVLFSSNLYSTGTTIALGLPFVLGLGMAIPWPIAGAGLAALPKPGAWMVHVKHALGVLILATAAYYGYEAYRLFSPAAAAAHTVNDGWHTSLSDALVVAKRENKAVFVDMWATWCKNCFVMDETTFKEDAVRVAMDKYVLVKFQAEDPEAQPAKALMERFESVGLPTYAILQPK
ncbi:MAG: cytochrome c biogenesis protein CcdA [Vicinamibacterales bacterium]